MANTGRRTGKAKAKGKAKGLTHQPEVVNVPRNPIPEVGSPVITRALTPDIMEQNLKPTDPMQQMLNPAGLKLTAFMNCVQQDTTKAADNGTIGRQPLEAIENPSINRQQSFEAVQTMLHVSVSCQGSCTGLAMLTISA